MWMEHGLVIIVLILCLVATFVMFVLMNAPHLYNCAVIIVLFVCFVCGTVIVLIIEPVKETMIL